MKTAPALLCLLALAACSGKPPTPESDAKAAASSQQPAAPWDAMKQDEQRAKNVQKIVDKQAADQNKQIEQQTQ